MTMVADIPIWGIHGGRSGEADSLFLRHNVVALAFTKMGDLSRLSADREAFKVAVRETYPDKKPGAIPNFAGQLYRFAHEMQIGDLIAYPSKQTRTIHLGRIDGPYEYKTDIEPGYPHRRSVTWLKEIPRTRLTQGALYEIGSAITFFQVKNYSDEYRQALSGTLETVTPESDETDDTVALVAEEIEETTRDFILKRLAQELKGHPFSHLVAHLLQKMGYRTRVSPPGPDGGIDIIAHRDELGFEPPIIKVQVKSSESAISEPDVSALYGKVDQGEYGLFVSLGRFKHTARSLERNKSNLRLLDGDDIVQLILTHYESLDPKYKGLIPLKSVYVPTVLDDEIGSES
ncbi:MAG: restriction endonuclease [Planctomycetota bacterium]